MKSLKLAVMAIFTLAAVSNLNAQDEDNPWAISIGMNAFDARLGSAFGDHLKDYYGTRDWDVFPSLSRISAEKYLDDGFTLQFAGSFNRITSSYYSSAPGILCNVMASTSSVVLCQLVATPSASLSLKLICK